MKLNTQQKVDLAMRMLDKPCTGDTECDLDDPCHRHGNIASIISRYERIRKDER